MVKIGASEGEAVGDGVIEGEEEGSAVGVALGVVAGGTDVFTEVLARRSQAFKLSRLNEARNKRRGSVFFMLGRCSCLGWIFCQTPLAGQKFPASFCFHFA